MMCAGRNEPDLAARWERGPCQRWISAWVRSWGYSYTSAANVEGHHLMLFVVRWPVVFCCCRCKYRVGKWSAKCFDRLRWSYLGQLPQRVLERELNLYYMPYFYSFDIYLFPACRVPEPGCHWLNSTQEAIHISRIWTPCLPRIRDVAREVLTVKLTISLWCAPLLDAHQKIWKLIIVCILLLNPYLVSSKLQSAIVLLSLRG